MRTESQWRQLTCWAGSLTCKWLSWAVKAVSAVWLKSPSSPDASVSSHFNWASKFSCPCYLVLIVEFSFTVDLVIFAIEYTQKEPVDSIF